MYAFWLTVDIVTSAALVLCAFAALGAYSAHRRKDGDVMFWRLAGAGMLYLSVDERFSLHERYGRWVDGREGFRPPLPVNHADDLFLAAFALIGLVVAARYSRVLLARRAVALLLLAGSIGLVATIAIDALAPVEGAAPAIEELLELAGTLLITGAFLCRWRVWLVRCCAVAARRAARDSRNDAAPSSQALE